MRSFLLVVGLAAACLAAEIPKNVSDAIPHGATPALVVPAAAPAAPVAQNATSNSTSGGSIQLRPEDLLRPEINFNPVTSTEKAPAVDSLFPDIHLQHSGPPSMSAVPAPTYVVNDTHHAVGGDNLMEVTTKHTFIMKINATTVKTEGAHPEPEPEPEPEPAAEPEPSSGTTKGSTTHGGKQTTLKPNSLPKTSSAASIAPALLTAAVALLISKLC